MSTDKIISIKATENRVFEEGAGDALEKENVQESA